MSKRKEPRLDYCPYCQQEAVVKLRVDGTNFTCLKCHKSWK